MHHGRGVWRRDIACAELAGSHAVDTACGYRMRVFGLVRVRSAAAAGGIREDLVPGDIMLISDHINMLGSNPLGAPGHFFVRLFLILFWGRFLLDPRFACAG
jgi:hypothetical protein